MANQPENPMANPNPNNHTDLIQWTLPKFNSVPSIPLALIGFLADKGHKV